MENVFISDIVIEKVRHLENLEIPLSNEEMKHLIITGKNGSGKTSLLNEIAGFLNMFIWYNKRENKNYIEVFPIDNYANRVAEANTEYGVDNQYRRLNTYYSALKCGIQLTLNQEQSYIQSLFQKGEFVVAYYQADRIFKAEEPKHVEKVELKDGYNILDTPREEFIKYLLDMKMTEALAIANGKPEKAEKIKYWIESFQELLKMIFEDDSVRLLFDEDTFRFSISMNGREPFDFNTLSSGYAAILDVVVDLIIRMEKHSNRTFDFSVPGIVLIDEIETHLHLELQRKILSILTTIFSNIQFVVSTHSPFILNSLDNVVIFDLENRTLVKNGLSDVPYGGIVEGYFKADEMSAILREKYSKYKELVYKRDLTDDDMEEIADLEMYLDEIPDYLALNITTEYQRLKQELRKRDDI